MTEGKRTDVGSIVEFLHDRIVEQAIEGRVGDAVTHPAPFTSAGPGSIAFARRGRRGLPRTPPGGGPSLVLTEPNAFSALDSVDAALIVVADARREFARVVHHYFLPDPVAGVHPTASVSEDALLGSDCRIGAGAFIGPKVSIGDGCQIGENAVVLEGTKIGSNSRIGPNCTVGGEGFGYVRDEDGTPMAMPHLGGVTIGSNVEVGANTCIDRGTIEDTSLGDNVKVDNLVHIAHNCRIEDGAFVIASAMLAGGVRVGRNAWIAPQASVREQLEVGAGALVGLGAVVLGNVPDGATVFGVPARPLQP